MTHTTDTPRGADGAIDRLRTEATGPLGFDPDSPMARDILTLIARAEAAERLVGLLNEHRDGLGRVAQAIVDAGYPSGDSDPTIISFVAHVCWLLDATTAQDGAERGADGA
jgi:hypothetical protein